MEMVQHFKKIRDIVDKGGPEPSEYDFLTETCDELMHQGFSLTEESNLYDEIKPLLNVDSMIGFSFRKPNGYAGDYELIDRIYQQWKSPENETFHKWDAYYHDLQAARAVRNRKEYLKEQLRNLTEKIDSPIVLNLASGPCSDLYEYFTSCPKTPIKFDCLDLDLNAIEYGSAVCDNYINRIHFINKNAFRYSPQKKYHLIWSAGLFDYFSDKLFIRLTNRMYKLLEKGGELVVGNFSTNNPSRGLMEVMLQWYLHHRDEKMLMELAIKAGVPSDKIRVSAEQTGVNLFLHMSK